MALVLVALLLVGVALPALARDIYVSWQRGNNRQGQGTMDSPYKHLGYALRQAQAGDTLHIAEGHYPGEGNSGRWTVEVSNLTLMGGYRDDFGERDPYRYVTLLAFDDSPSNQTRRTPGAELQAQREAGTSRGLAGIVIDGLTLDGGPRNAYFDDPENPSMRTDQTPNDPLIFVTLDSGVGIIRNCTLLNPGVSPGILAQARPGARFEIYNNVFVNSVQHQIDLHTRRERGSERAEFDVHHNTFLFSWATSSGGSGVYVRPYGDVRIHRNILAFGDDCAVQNSFYEQLVDERGVPKGQVANENVWMEHNLLYMWQRGLYGWVLSGRSGILVSVTLDDLWDSSLASAEGNQIGDPGFDYEAEWMDLFVNRSGSSGGEVTMDAVNQFRARLGLPLRGTTGTGRVGYCCRYPLEHAMAFRQPTWQAHLPLSERWGASWSLMTGPGAVQELTPAGHAPGRVGPASAAAGAEDPSSGEEEATCACGQVCPCCGHCACGAHCPQGGEG